MPFTYSDVIDAIASSNKITISYISLKYSWNNNLAVEMRSVLGIVLFWASLWVRQHSYLETASLPLPLTNIAPPPPWYSLSSSSSSSSSSFSFPSYCSSYTSSSSSSSSYCSCSPFSWDYPCMHSGASLQETNNHDDGTQGQKLLILILWNFEDLTLTLLPKFFFPLILELWRSWWEHYAQ